MAMGMKPYVFESLIKDLILIIFVNDRNVMYCNFNSGPISLYFERISVSVENEKTLYHIWVHSIDLINVFECKDMEISTFHRVLHQYIKWSKAFSLYLVKHFHICFYIFSIILLSHFPSNKRVWSTDWGISYHVDLLDSRWDLIKTTLIIILNILHLILFK